MSDEGRMGDPVDAIEMAQGMRDLASATMAFYKQLRNEGFSSSDAIKLTSAWISGLAGSQK